MTHNSSRRSAKRPRDGVVSRHVARPKHVRRGKERETLSGCANVRTPLSATVSYCKNESQQKKVRGGKPERTSSF